MQSDWLGLLRQPRFRQFFLTRVAGSLAGRFLFTGIAWQVFHQTRDPFASGVLGLVEIIPVLAFALVAGHVCDRYDRRAIAVITRLGMLIASIMLLVFAILKLPVSLVLLAVGIRLPPTAMHSFPRLRQTPRRKPMNRAGDQHSKASPFLGLVQRSSLRSASTSSPCFLVERPLSFLRSQTPF